MISLHGFGMIFRKARNMKTCKFHDEFQYIREVGPKNNTKLGFNIFKKRYQNKMKQNCQVWGPFLLQNDPLRPPRQIPKPPQAASGSLKASPGSLCASCLAPPGTPCEPLAPSWHCLGASRSYLGSLGTPNTLF